MENVHDWGHFSRQLWWGHQIAAWYHVKTGEMYVGMEAPADSELATRSRCFRYVKFESSGFMAFSTMGWPDETSEDYQR